MKTLIRWTFISGMAALVLQGCIGNRSSAAAGEEFTAQAVGEYMYVGPDTLPNPKCTEPLSAWRAIVVAKGNGRPVGAFTIYFDFCGDTAGHYGNGECYMVTEKGDTLFFEVSGQVIDGRLDEHPDFVTSWWRDEFTIIGGTGKYKGAVGTVLSNDYNSSEDPYSHHMWSGHIELRDQVN